MNVVVMFPYPSGAGLHMGHYYNYAIIDSFCRFHQFNGIEIHQPFGYDAFGLPAENYARKIGGDARVITYQNIEVFRQQMARMNTRYKEKLITSDSEYQKWTQWVFLKLKEHDLAYKADSIVPVCPSCETVLANEQVTEDERCDRCGTAVDQQMLNQWFFRITAYRDRLVAGLDRVDYPESTIKQQRQWLAKQRDWCVSRQRRWGCPIPVEGERDTLDTFVDSSFYYLRYLTDSPDEFLPKGCYKPVDLYVGGAEHACMHLIYARFIHYFLHDIGVVPQEEPFNKVIHQGMITKDGVKMGKSKGNTVNPDDYDPDELRMFLMFIGPYTQGGEWTDLGIVGIQRFLNRFRSFLVKATVAGVDLDIGPFRERIATHVGNWKFNKVVSSFMEFYNENKGKVVSIKTRDELCSLLKCFAPGFRYE